MTLSFDAYAIHKVLPLRNSDYAAFLLRQIEQAKQRIWASVFIVNVSRAADPEQLVRNIVHKLERARRRGLDVRVLVGDSESTLSIRMPNHVARQFLHSHSIPSAIPTTPDRSSSHDKYVLIDGELLILGSHNWTDNAFRVSEEDSLAIYSECLVKVIEAEFLSQWPAATIDPPSSNATRLSFPTTISSLGI